MVAPKRSGNVLRYIFEERLLEISCLSPLKIDLNGQPLKLPSRRTEALFVYLIRNPQPHARDVLANLFWDDIPQKKALGNLRVLLSNLRKTLEPHVIISRQTVAFNTDSPHRVDLNAVAEGFALGRAEMPQNGVLPWETTTQFGEVLSAYQGDLLPGFYLRNGQGFEAWLATEREWLQTRVVDALVDLATAALHWGEYRWGIEQAQRLVQLDPLREEGHQQLMQLWAADGQMSAALAQYDRWVKLLDDEMDVPPTPKTTALFEQIRGGTWQPPNPTVDQPPLTAARPPLPEIPHNLPRELTPFIGREDELTHLTPYLLNPAYPLITVVGEGGSGKTRLALAAAHQLTTQENFQHHELFADGVWFVSLAALTPERLDLQGALASAISRAMGLQLLGARPLMEQLLVLLQNRRCLLILDNLEQLIPPDDAPTDQPDAIDFLMTLMAQAPQLHLLVTSRIAVDLNSEFVIPLGGLPVPDQAFGARKSEEGREKSGEFGVSDLAAYTSVQLFVERASRVAGDQPPAQQLSEIGAICRFVEGSPLGIELAAAWCGSHTPFEILLSLQSNLDLLSSRRRDIPPRQRSIRAVFDHSWQLLSVVAKQVLVQTACFRDGFTLEAAQAVIFIINDGIIDGSNIDGSTLATTSEIESTLESLIRASLLQQDEAGRYRIHTLLHGFISEKLDDCTTDEASVADQFSGIFQRHSHYYLDLAEQARINAWYTRAALASIHVELPNIQQSWRWASVQCDVASLRRGWLGVWHFYTHSAQFREGEEAFYTAMVHLRNEEARQAADAISPQYEQTVYQLKAAHANFLNGVGRYEEAVAVSEPVAEYAKHIDDAQLDAMSHLAWGSGLYRQGQTTESLDILTKGVAAARKAEQPLLEARIQRRLANALQADHNFPEARAHYEGALALNRQHGHQPEEAEVLSALGWCLQQEHDISGALLCLNEALQLHQTIDNPYGSNMTLINLGVVYNMQDEFSKVLACQQQVLDQLEKMDDPYQRALVNHSRAVTLSKLGDYASAESHYQIALATDMQMGDRAGVAWTYNNVGLLHGHLGDYEAALAFHQDARQISLDLGATTSEGLAWSRLGQDFYGLGELEESYEAYLKAIEIQQRLNQVVWAIESKSGLAATQLALNLIEDAMRLVEEILQFMESETLDGARERLLVYWNCYQVLDAASDPRADSVLTEATQCLENAASTLTDPSLKRTFLEGVPFHRALRKEYYNRS